MYTNSHLDADKLRFHARHVVIMVHLTRSTHTHTHTKYLNFCTSLIRSHNLYFALMSMSLVYVFTPLRFRFVEFMHTFIIKPNELNEKSDAMPNKEIMLFWHFALHQ